MQDQQYFLTMSKDIEYRGYKVNYVQNFTDVDDKMIKKANEEGVDIKVMSIDILRLTLKTRQVNLKEEGMC